MTSFSKNDSYIIKFLVIDILEKLKIELLCNVSSEIFK